MISPVETIKNVPPIVWLIGGAVVVGVVVLKSGGGGSTSTAGGVSSAGGGGGGGGEGRDELTNLSQGFVDLVEEVRQNEAADADWRKAIEAKIATGAPTNTNPPAGTPAPTTPVNFIKKTYGADVPTAIKSKYSLTSLDAVFAKARVNYGTAVNVADLKAVLKKEKISYGSTVDPADLAKLFKKTGITPVAPRADRP